MTTKEIHDEIQNFDACSDGVSDRMVAMLNIMQAMNERIAALETKVESLDKELFRASNTASCLANGIQPD